MNHDEMQPQQVSEEGFASNHVHLGHILCNKVVVCTYLDRRPNDRGEVPQLGASFLTLLSRVDSEFSVAALSLGIRLYNLIVLFGTGWPGMAKKVQKNLHI